jgi:hypothetical protein
MHEAAVAYGDDIPSPSQRAVALAAVIIAFVEAAYGWLVAGMMAAAPNPRLTATSILLASIILANGALMFGRARPLGHWLRIFYLASIALMIGLPTALVLIAMAHSGS